MRRLRLFFSGLLAVAAAAMAWPASAQQFSFADLPVLEPKPDFNGVDPGTGSFATESPLTFGAPGAGHLNVRASFNTMVFSFSLNVFLIDDTYTPGGSDPGERHIRIHLGGVDKLFTCHVNASCAQVGEVDGSSLTRTGAVYVLRDREGAAYTFFPQTVVTINEACSDYDSGCNAAEYQASAYVSTIVYPSGEKLTYQPFPVIEHNADGTVNTRDTIMSNLGYRLVFERSRIPPRSSSIPAGHNWFAHRGLANPVNMSLYRDSALIGTLTTSTIYSNQNQDRTTKMLDSLGRVYQVDMQTRTTTTHCVDHQGFPQTYRVPLPVRVVSPAGVETNLAYHTQLSANLSNSLPVKTVTRGGRTWTYDNVATGKTLTTPTSKTRTVASAWYHDGWDRGAIGSFCAGRGMGRIGYKITSVTNELNHSSTYDYHWIDGVKLKSATLPELNGYDYDYDGRGNLTRITQLAKPGSGKPGRVIFEASYPSCSQSNLKICNKPEWVEDAKNNRTDYTYDPVHGGVLTVTRPPDANGVRGKTINTYAPHDTGDGIIYRLRTSSSCIAGSNCVTESDGQLVGTADERRVVATYWNSTFLPLTVTEMVGDGSLSVLTSYGYDDAGRPVHVTNPRGHTTHFFYDAAGRKVGEISADPDGADPLPRIATRIAYNDDDQITVLEQGTASGTTSSHLQGMTVINTFVTTYDGGAGLKIREEMRVGATTHTVRQFGYYDDERLECIAVRMNPSQFGLLPQDACALSVAGSFGPDRITRHVYTPTGELRTITKAYGVSLQQDYATYGYNLNGKRTSVIDANGNKSRFDYDGYDRLEHWYLPSKTAIGQIDSENYEHYGYDANDNRISLRKRDGRIIGYGYDALNRMVSKDLPDTTAGDVYYGYDLRGLQTYARFGSATGAGVTNAYDGLGRLRTSANDMAGAGQVRVLSHQPDANGNREKLTFPDGNFFSFNYDALDRMTAIRENGGTVVSLGYDAQGRRSTLTGGVSSSYGYDDISRLSSVSHNLADTAHDVTYGFTTYNPANQIIVRTLSNDSYAWSPETNLSTGYASNGLNQYTSVGSQGVSHDDNGNLRSIDGLTLSYDVENRLISASGSKTATLSYDPLGRLYETSGEAAGKTRFLYDGDALAAEYDDAGNLLRRYAHGPGVDEPLLWYEGDAVSAAARRVLRSDHHGSVVAVADSAGASIGLNRYDAYGVSPSPVVGRFAYTGQIVIPELEMYHYKSRMYSPALGRFLQTDSVGYEGDVNLYAYVKNDPLNATDPTGKFPFLIPVIGYGLTAMESAVFVSTAVVAGVGAGAVINEAKSDQANKPASQPNREGTTNGPAVPKGLVGAQDDKAAPRGNRHNSGPLTPDNGGSGDAASDFEHLTGGRSGPAPEGSRYPSGTRVGENGIVHRPGTEKSGPRIDIPANGEKPHETLHYPPPMPPPDPKLR